MKIAVVGASGTAGRRTVQVAEERGHEVIAISRSTGVDLLAGTGLAEALTGADVVIDTSNAFPPAGSDLVGALAGATRYVVDAAEAAGVGHLVHLSICNIDQPAFDGFDYYLAKREQERIVTDSGLSSTIVRSAQWFEFATNPAAVVQTEDTVTVQDWLIQPIAVRTVGEVLVDEATDRTPTRAIAGPDPIRLPELTARYLQAIGDDRPVETTPAVLPELSEGVLRAPANADLLGPDLSTWLGASTTRVRQ